MYISMPYNAYLPLNNNKNNLHVSMSALGNGSSVL